MLTKGPTFNTFASAADMSAVLCDIEFRVGFSLVENSEFRLRVDVNLQVGGLVGQVLPLHRRLSGLQQSAMLWGFMSLARKGHRVQSPFHA